MSFLTKWFKKTGSDDYETVLSTLALDIQKRQTRLSEIRLRERRSTLLVTLYAVAFWGAYLALWYSGLIPVRRSPVDKAAKGLPVVVGPVVILFTRRIVQIWYTRIGDAEEKTLRDLLKQQRAKVEEIKKKTNYYSTRNLLERYDEPDSPLRRRSVAPPQLQSVPTTPQAPPQKQPMPPALIPLPSSSPQPLPTPRKQWYDKLADALLGDDDSPSTAASSRYALICEKCFAHNGLVKESLWDETQYTCPKCGHFNPSARAKKALVSTSPCPPASQSQMQNSILSPRQPRPLGRDTGREEAKEGEPEEEGKMEVDQ